MWPSDATARAEGSLTDTRVVDIGGSRPSGKTTRARVLSGAARPRLGLDDETMRRAVPNDAAGILRGLDRAAIDEVRRAPERLPANGRSVDLDPRRDRCWLTGALGLRVPPTVADPSAGLCRFRIQAQAAGPRFGARVLRRDGEPVRPDGERLRVTPIACLWIEEDGR